MPKGTRKAKEDEETKESPTVKVQPLLFLAFVQSTIVVDEA
jgi:hypothetical protein